MTTTGYVAAAYLVFLALVLIYVAIMAVKLARIGREVEALASDLERPAVEPSSVQRQEVAS